MHRPALRRTRKLFRNVRAVWQFLKPHPAIHSSKPRFTRLGLQWKRVDKAGTVRRTYTKENTRRVRLLRKFLNRYMIGYTKFARSTEEVKQDRYRLTGWAPRRQQFPPNVKAAEFILRGPWVVGPKYDREEQAMKRSGHPASTPEPSRMPLGTIDRPKTPIAETAYQLSALDCIDYEFHSIHCGCEDCVPAVAVGDFTEPKKTTTRRRAPRKKT